MLLLKYSPRNARNVHEKLRRVLRTPEERDGGGGLLDLSARCSRRWHAQPREGKTGNISKRIIANLQRGGSMRSGRRTRDDRGMRADAGYETNGRADEGAARAATVLSMLLTWDSFAWKVPTIVSLSSRITTSTDHYTDEKEEGKKKEGNVRIAFSWAGVERG